jgi:amino acid adenylation domain-containing protein/non-ribosomal peptide synthase protein (TIGR01720 family)
VSLLESLLSALRARGVALWVDGDQLRYKAPKGALTPELLDGMRSRKAEIIAFIDRAGSAGAGDGPVPVRRPAGTGPAPLAFAQQRLWFLDQLEGPSAVYNIAHAMRLRGRLDRAALCRALAEIVRRHDALRTTIGMPGGDAVQIVHADRPLPLTERDLRALPAAERLAEARRIGSEEAGRPFDLVAGPLLRLTLLTLDDSDHVLVMATHHIVSDGWSLGVVIRELAALYPAFRNGRPSPLEELPVQYGDYAAWQREWLSGPVLERQLDFWKRQMAGAPQVLELPADRPRPARQTANGALFSFGIDADLTTRVQALCRDTGCSLFMTLLAGFAALLARYSGQQDLVVGTAVAGRGRREFEPMVGFFVNTLVLRNDLSGDPSFAELLGQVRRTCLDAYSHQDLPFERLVEALQSERHLGHLPLAQVMFRVENAQMIGRLDLPDLAVTPLEIDRRTSSYDLTLMVRETSQGLDGDFEYNTDLFDCATIARMAGHYRTLLSAAVADPARRLSALPLLDDGERRLVAGSWTAEARPYEVESVVPAVFAAQVARNPEAVAVVAGDRTLSYRDLDRAATRLAHRLRRLGVGPEVPVGLCLDHTSDLPVAIMAILKAGSAYLPLDPSFPAERVCHILGEAGASLLVTRRDLPAASWFGQEGTSPVTLVFLDDADDDTDPPPLDCAAGPDNLAYIIYTSGSTGTPKGVMIEHRSLLNLVRGLHDRVYPRADRPLRVALLASAAFDASVQQIFGCLLGGHALHIVDSDTRRDGARLVEFLRNARIDLADGTPSLLSIMIAADLAGDAGSSLRSLVIGGEALPTVLIDSFYGRRLRPDIAITNIYGPTECTVDVIAHRIDPDQKLDGVAVPLGRPLPNARVLILDPRSEPVPIGIPGEICIGGVPVGRGYRCNPALTAARFVPDPSGPPGARLYRTGDLGRWRADGTIEFLGRIDHQVKVRGYRIEPGEIEATLFDHPAVREAVVIARPPAAGSPADLIAYLVCDGMPTVEELRRWCGRRLPDYMIPAYFVALDALLLNSSGKTDRKALPDPTRGQTALLGQGGDHVAPRDEIEQRLAEVWQAVLRREAIGVRDNYFFLGGDSIKALQIAARLRDLGLKLEIRDLFLHPTIEDLAPCLKPLTRVGSDERQDGPVPLTAIQARFFSEFGGAVGHFNQAVLLRAASPLALPALGAALGALHDRHDALRLRFHRDADGVWWQELAAPGTLASALAEIDLRRAADPAAALTADAAARQAAADLARGPLLRAVVYRLPDGDRLLLLAHHLIIDGVSWRILLDQLTLAYNQARRSAAVELPAGSNSFARWAGRVQAHAARPQPDERAFWAALPLAACRPLPVGGPPGTQADRRHLPLALTAEETAALLTDAHRAYGTEINDLLLAALARTLHGWAGPGPVAVMLEGHGRESLEDGDDLDLSATLGWFTSLFPVVLNAGDDDPGLTIKRTKESLRAVPRKGVGYGILRYLGDPAAEPPISAGPAPLIAFNYLGQFETGGDDGAFATADEPIGPTVDPRAPLDFALELVGMVTAGRLTLDIAYDAARLDTDQAADFAAAYRRELTGLVAHALGRDGTALTPSDIDFDGFDVEGLDAFLETLG